MGDAPLAAPLVPPSRLVAHLKACHLDDSPHAAGRLAAGLVGGALIVPALQWHAGQPAIPLRATRAADGGTVLHTFTDLSALRAALGSASWAAYPFLAVVDLARQRGCAAVVINESGPWAAVLDVAGLDAEVPAAAAAAPESAPDRRAVEATRERAAELRRVAEHRRQSGDRAEARTALAGSIVLDEEIGDLVNAAFALSDLGALDCALGALDLAAEGLGRALALFERLHNRRGAALVQANLGWVALAGGDRQGAIEHAGISLSLDGGAGAREVAVGLAGAAANLALEHRETDLAIQAARLAGGPALLVAALSARGWEAFAEHRVEAAAADFSEAADAATASGDAALLARAQLDLAWLDARLGDVAAARRGADHARTIDPGPETDAAAAELLRLVDHMEQLREGTAGAMIAGIETEGEPWHQSR